ncbi:MAG: ATP synthase F1 subunit gamma [Phycisphaerales bacterium]|nr:ATP synthase F1 subunit gamma [Phycisphaerales bacterium]
MGKTREIKKRIKAVGNIRRITNTMRMIATSKFARAQQKATATKPYTEGVFELVRKIAATGGGQITHPLIAGNPAAKDARELTLIITSDRGLCGPYNGSILRTAMAHLKAEPEAKAGLIELVGRKGAAFLKFNNVAVATLHAIGDKPDFATIERIAQDYMDRFAAGQISKVNVIFMRYISAGRQKPEVMQLLPLKPPAEAEGRKPQSVEYEFSPPAPQLLGVLLPAAVKATLFQAINDAIVSEHIARMVAMKSATDNAGKMGKRLTRQYNRARQAQITTELTEIISGAAALE